MTNEQDQIKADFENFHKAAANAIAACEAFIEMDINAPRAESQRPIEAIRVGILAERVEKKD